MRVAFFTIAGVLASSSATLLLPRQSLPNCAAGCLAAAPIGTCQPNDDSCLCKNPTFVQNATACIESTCTGSDLTTAESDAQQLCLAVGVTLTATPTASAAASGTATTPSTHTTTSAPAATTSKSAATDSIHANAVAGAVAFALGLCALVI